MKPSVLTSCLVIFGTAHALVDATCIMLLLGGIDVREDLLAFIILYNVLAFGLQLPFGWLLDRLQQPVLAAISGCVMVSAAVLLFMHPLVAIGLAGIGNALFHVGGGTVALNLKPGKASLPGLFVAPGGIGLFAGAMILPVYGFHPQIFAIALLCAGVLMLVVKSPQIFYSASKEKTGSMVDFAILLLMITICIRSIVGLSMHFSWQTDRLLLYTIPLAIALGKGMGGFLADSFGWIKIAVGGLVISSILLLYGEQTAVAGIAGLFFFNLTMPVTLVAISNMLPGRPGISFGLTTMAILAGALPTFMPIKALFAVNHVMMAFILLSAVTLYAGLKIIPSKNFVSKILQP